MITTIIIILLILLLGILIINGILLVKYKEKAVIIDIPKQKLTFNWSSNG